jgi:hypothetical protein
MNYRQCQLRKDKQHLLSWIPEARAVKGAVLRLKNDGQWDDGWVVDEVYGTRTEAYVRAHERDHLKTRRYSDV